MKRFKNILVVYDGSVGAEDALTQATTLAEANGARLKVVDLAEEGRYSFDRVRENERRLHRLIPTLRTERLQDVEAKVLVGIPFIEVIREVQRGEHDLVIASAEGGSVISSVFFGSTAAHLIRKCPCPVWISKPGQTIPYQRLLAAIDPKPGDPVSIALNDKIIQLATSLAQANKAHLDIVHAWEVLGKDADTLASETPEGVRSAILAKHEEAERTAITTFLQRHELGGVDHDLLLRRDRPERAIVETVQRSDAGLIVMGTVDRVGIPGFLIGNAAESVLEAVTCGVLAIKPDSFASPVSLI